MITQDGRREQPWPLLFALLVVAGLYLATLAVNHGEAEDSTWYADAITRGAPAYQFHPNHLLYNFANRVFFRGWQMLGYGGAAELPAKLLNVAAALAVLALVDSIARRACVSPRLRAVTLLAIASGFGFWWYSVEVETYVLPLVFVLLALRQLLVVAEDFGPLRGHIRLGIYVGLAILLHQQHLVLGLVILAGYAAILRGQAVRVGAGAAIGRIALFGAVSLGLVGAVYLIVLVGVLGRTSPDEMMAWLRSAGSVGGYGYGLSLGALKSFIGLGRAFIGGHFLFGFPSVAALVSRLAPDYDLREEAFLVADFSPAGLAALVILTLTAAALVATLVVIVAARRRAGTLARPMGQRRLLLAALTAYIALYGVFNALFLPESVEVWVAVAPAIILAGVLIAAPGLERPLATGLLAAAVALVFAVNLFGSVLPMLQPERDYWRQHNAWLMENANAGDLVVMDTGYISGGYVTFYSGARVFDATVGGAAAARRLERALAQEPAARVLVAESQMPDDAAGAHVRKLYDDLAPRLQLLHADEWQTIYELLPR